MTAALYRQIMEEVAQFSVWATKDPIRLVAASFGVAIFGPVFAAVALFALYTAAFLLLQVPHYLLFGAFF